MGEKKKSVRKCVKVEVANCRKLTGTNDYSVIFVIDDFVCARDGLIIGFSGILTANVEMEASTR